MNIVFDDRFEEFNWWVIWKANLAEPDMYGYIPIDNVKEFYDFKRKVNQWAAEQQIPIRGRSIHHIDTLKRYMGFKSEYDALTFILVWKGSER